MKNKRIILLAMALLGLLSVPVANADVVVRYIVVDNGYYHEPMTGYYPGSRLYSNTSRFGNITYSNGLRYRNRCEDDRYYYQPHQYRNNYYYGYQDRYQKHHDRYRYHRDAPHGGKYNRHNSGGRVHININ